MSSKGRGGFAVLTQEADGLHQLGVAVGYRRHLLAPTVAVLDDHRVPAVDLDVLHVRHLQEWLQPAVAEHRVLDRRDVRLLLSRRPELSAVPMQGTNMITDNASDDRAAQQQPIFAAEWTAT